MKLGSASKIIRSFTATVLAITGVTLLGSSATTLLAQKSNSMLPPSGLVGWWKGDGNALDSVAANNGMLAQVGFTNGMVGQAFSFDPENHPWGSYTGVKIADQPAYALTNSLTIEGWIRPRGDGYIIFFRGDHRPGMDPYALSMQGNNLLDFEVTDAAGNYVRLDAAVPYHQWTHVAATLDGRTGIMRLYTNGIVVAQATTSIRPFGALLPDQSPGIGIGNVNDGGNNFPFLGDIDEISLYNRALSQAEIQAIYNAGSAGKGTLPVITMQPADQTVAAGDTALFNVTASGTQPLTYQWYFNSHGISNATNSWLVISNAQPAQAGNYSVTVANLAGSVTSSNATLTLKNTTPVPVSSGMVAWWKGEGNSLDSIGLNHGIWHGTAEYAAGKVGQAFNFDGTNWLQVSNTPSLHFTNAMTVEAWIKVNQFDTDYQAIVTKGDSSWRLQRDSWISGHGIQFAANGLSAYHLESTKSVDDGQWHYVAGVYDGSRIYLYIDGVLDVSAPASGSINQNNYPVCIGENAEATGRYFNGLIDEVSLYNRALSSNEIAAIYDAGSAGKGIPTSAGMVGQWKGDGNGVDTVGGNNGVLVNTAFTNGVVNQAFAFDPGSFSWGTYCGVQIADQPAYVLTNSLSIEGWIRPRGDGYNIFWRGDHRPGDDPYCLSMQGNHVLAFFIEDSNNVSDHVSVSVNYGTWTHVAATLDGNTGTMSLYTNGVLAAQKITSIRPFGELDSSLHPGIGIGNVNDGGNNFPFTGDIDEISLYNRALTPAEIQANYAATPPVVLVQPADQIVVAGNTATFRVAVQSPAPLNYQWRCNGTNVLGGNGAELVLTNVCRSQVGNYTVLAANSIGGVVSSNATLQVRVPQVLSAPRMQPDGSLQMTACDADGGAISTNELTNFEAQVSTNLVNWSTLPNGLILTNGHLQVQDHGRTNCPARFYRIIEH